MQLTVVPYELAGSIPHFGVIHPGHLASTALLPGDIITIEGNEIGLRVFTSPTVGEGEIGISKHTMEEMELTKKDKVTIREIATGRFLNLIHKKFKKRPLLQTEITEIMNSIDKNLMSHSHIAAFVTAVKINGMTKEETTYMAQAIIDMSSRLPVHRRPVVDKHSIGGIAGNRVTPVIIPIIAACDLTIPKVSTRAITSPAGTADVCDLFMEVDLHLDEVSEVLRKTGGCIVSGEDVGLGTVADKMICVLKELKMDPEELMVASILAKKRAAGSEYVLIDLPTGKGAKVHNREDARRLANLFTSIGLPLGLKVDAIISPGDRPIGNYIGPALEARDVLNILQCQGGSQDLKRKALALSGLILEEGGYCNRGEGYEYARRVLESSKAWIKMQEIIEAQGGDPKVATSDLPQASRVEMVRATGEGIIYGLNSRAISNIARAAGAPFEECAGLILHVERGDRINKGDVLFEIHADSSTKMQEALNLAMSDSPVALERMVLEFVRGHSEL